MEDKRKTYQKVGLYLGPFLAIAVFLLPAPGGLSTEAWRVVAFALWMAAWWGTEAVPIPITSLIPLAAFPVLGIHGMRETAAPYANPVIFLLLGGFIMAMALQRWKVHRRIALTILLKFKNQPGALVGGFMVTAAALSMWISNTATAIMMIPIALSVASSVKTDSINRQTFTTVLLLGTAYAASIGGFGTLIGTPPNALVRAYMEQTTGVVISFTDWMLLGVPAVLALLPAAWVILTRVAYRMKPFKGSSGHDYVKKELEKMGPMKVPEKRVFMLFGLIALSWISRPFLAEFTDISFFSNLSDTGIAIFGAILMFLIPAGKTAGKGIFLLDWDWAVKLPWGVILLFGGGLSLAATIQATGLSTWLGAGLEGFTHYHLFILVTALVTLVVFLTELTSNTATTAALLPILGAIAGGGHIDPLMLAAPAALAASCAFMLPVATGPNAIIFASGQITIPEMSKGGIGINFAAIVILSTLCYMLVPMIFG